ncbi:MAG TPA: Asp-tRNA(Asn)/Glu-tRNA(Gln) amidotransferase subunit GatA [Acidobacteriota bacterium]|nr:Asp-tRNA(Asn)/Glu-tRNA(Gln) amidotransferase subunit GatA [Acidobacteriota bacterium]
MNEICRWSVRQLRDALKRRELSVSEIARAFLERFNEIDSEVRAFLHVDPERTMRQAAELERSLARGEKKLGFLTGIPLAVKDNISTRGVPTTCGSRILKEYVPTYDATVIQRLRLDGALLLGKTNCDEFAMGSSTENSAFFPSRNPRDLERVPGGSSGGSAAAVASFQVPAALGSDTGGSIRQPAAFCGIVGLKPTYGRVSRYGLIAFASSLDQIGPMTRTVRDAAVLLQVLAGPDSRDSTCSRAPVDNFVSGIGKDVRGWKIGVPAEWLSGGLDPEIRTAVESALKVLQGLGCSVREIRFPHQKHALAVYYIIAPSEASSNLARYDGVRFGHRSERANSLEEMYEATRSEGFGPEVKRRILIGAYALSAGYYDAYYLKAGKVRTLILQDFRRAFEAVDLIVGPTAPTLPFRLGEKTTDPLEMYLSDVFTVTANLAGVPGLSLPCAVSKSGLPIGLQILGPHFQEGRVLRLAHALERELTL